MVSVWLNRLLRELLVAGMLFADCAQSMRIQQPWAKRSWVKSSADMIPLIHAWKAAYAEEAPVLPCLEAWDFERLYTNIHLQDMYDSFIHLRLRSLRKWLSTCVLRNMHSG